MAVFLSPGVYTREIDLSLYIPSLSTTALGVVGIATKGPINEPTYVTNPVQFGSTFGDPADPSVEFLPSVYASLQYLHTGRQLWFVRVSEVDPAWDPGTGALEDKYLAKYAKTALTESSAPPVLTGTVNTLVTLSSANNVMHFVIDGAGPGFDITFVLPGSGTVTKSIPEIVTILNADPVFLSYMRASLSLTGSLVITGLTSGANHSIQISGLCMSSNIFGFPKIGATAYTPVTFGAGIVSETAFILGAGLSYPVTITGSVNDKLAVLTGVSGALAAKVEFTVPAGTYTNVSSLVTALNTISGFSTHLVASAFSTVSGIGQIKIALKATSANKYLALTVPDAVVTPHVDGPFTDGTVGVSENTFTPDTPPTWTINEHVGRNFVVATGDNAGTYTISANTATALTVTPDFPAIASTEGNIEYNDPITVGPFTDATITTGGAVFTPGTPPTWTIDEHIGRSFVVATGGNAGTYEIASNTADTLTITTTFPATESTEGTIEYNDPITVGPFTDSTVGIKENTFTPGVSPSWTINAQTGRSLVVATGLNAGTYEIVSNTATTLTVTPEFPAIASTEGNIEYTTSVTEDAGPFVFGGITGVDFVLSNLAVYPVTIPALSTELAFVQGSFSSTTTVPVSYTLPTGSLGADAPATVVTLNGLTRLDENNATVAFTDEFLASTVTKGANTFVKVSLAAGSTYDTLALGTGSGNALVFGAQPVQKKANTTAGGTLNIMATSQGTWGNALSIEIVANTTYPSMFNLNVYERGYQVEGFKNLVVTPMEVPDPLVPNTMIANPLYVENAINGVSSRITVTNATDNVTPPLPNPIGVRYVLAGGTNGSTTAASNPSLYIGVSDGLEKSGLQFFRNPEELDINLIAVPGIAEPAVINEMIDICQTRGDCMAIVDPPNPVNDADGRTPQSVVTWVNGNNGEHQAFNSSYAALYWPWLEIYDPVNKKTVWTPPSGHIANVYAYTDFNTDPWIAPAGLTRGRLVTPTKAQYNPTAGERDLLYSNNINPIATFVRDGINVFGQKTLQRKPSALDRVNVRRLMLYLEKVIATTARYILFEPNDQVTWLSFVNLTEPFLQSVKDRRGLIDFQIRCDATTNTPDVVDRSEMRAIIFLKPTKAAEFIQIDFVLTSQGANFDELVF